MSQIPATIRAGDTVTWRDVASADAIGTQISSVNWKLSYFLRSATAGAGLTVASTAYGTGWTTTISAAASAGLTPGVLYFQARTTFESDVHTLWTGSTKVLPALNYSGTPSAFDGRTQSQIDLEAVQAAIRALVSGGSVKKYTIGTRSMEKFTLAELMELEARLKARVQRELAAELVANGLGNPRNLFVRFN